MSNPNGTPDRDSKLYREGYATFEQYCRDRWGMSVSHGKRLVLEAVAERGRLRTLGYRATSWPVGYTEVWLADEGSFRESVQLFPQFLGNSGEFTALRSKV